MIAMQLSRVNKLRQQGLYVLQDIDLTIDIGEFFALIGVNGAGKTTLLKAILDFESIDSGEIQIFAQSHLNPQSRNNIAFLPEYFNPPQFLTGWKFLHYLSQLQQAYLSEITVKNLCIKLDLEYKDLHKPITYYSKGMRQKLGLIASFLLPKPLLILDEPTSGLDPKARAYLKKYLFQLKQNQQTMLFTTHLLFDIVDLCDRMAILHAGKLLFVGTPQQCCVEYSTSNLELAYLRCIGAEFYEY